MTKIVIHSVIELPLDVITVKINDCLFCWTIPWRPLKTPTFKTAAANTFNGNVAFSQVSRAISLSSMTSEGKQ